MVLCIPFIGLRQTCVRTCLICSSSWVAMHLLLYRLSSAIARQVLWWYLFDYMNTYADILYAYGAYVHGSQYSRRSQIRLIARLQSWNGTRYCSSGSQWKKKQKQHSSEQKEHNGKSTQHIIFIYSSVAISVHCCLHWCSHLTSCIGVRTLHLSRHPASALAPCFALPMVAALPLNCFWGWTW